MKNEQFDSMIKESIDSLDKNIDYKESIIAEINERKLSPFRVFVRRTFIMIAILVCTSSIIYAGVQTVIELKNENDEVIGTVEIVETDKNCHLDVHLSREAFIRYCDKLSSDPIWDDKSFIVIDTEASYPQNIDLRPKSHFLRSYNGFKDLEGIVLLPLEIGGYSFENVLVSYDADWPSEEEINQLIESHPNEKYIAHEVETGKLSRISYSFKNEELGLSMGVSIKIDSDSNILRYFTSTLKAYEIYQLDDIQAILSKSDYLGITYEENATTRVKGENHFTASWIEHDLNYKISIHPDLINVSRNNRKKVDDDGEMVYLEVYPDNTAELVKEFSLKVHELMKTE